MSTELQTNQALHLINQILPLLNEAEKHMKGARTWGIIDSLGGGFFTDLIKHSKLGSASKAMEQVNYLMQELGRVLGSMAIPEDYRMQFNGFLTFADFFFDGAFMDLYMTSKIWSSLEQIHQVTQKLLYLRDNLLRMG